MKTTIPVKNKKERRKKTDQSLLLSFSSKLPALKYDFLLGDSSFTLKHSNLLKSTVSFSS